jgi:hypothetical protein
LGCEPVLQIGAAIGMEAVEEREGLVQDISADLHLQTWVSKIRDIFFSADGARKLEQNVTPTLADPTSSTSDHEKFERRQKYLPSK